MRRITINVGLGIDDQEALDRVTSVVREGRISNYGTTYCYATVFRDGVTVYADRTRTGNDTFRVELTKR